MTCTICKRRPAPLSGASDVCIVCRKSPKRPGHGLRGAKRAYRLAALRKSLARRAA